MPDAEGCCDRSRLGVGALPNGMPGPPRTPVLPPAAPGGTPQGAGLLGAAAHTAALTTPEVAELFLSVFHPLFNAHMHNISQARL
jgi:hypothetical protein